MISNNKIISWVLGTLGVILLGAIGSGVWQVLGEPFIDFIVRLIINSMDLLFSTYKDAIYSKAALGFHESSANSSYALLLLLMSLLPVSFLLGRSLGITSKDQSSESRSKVLKIAKTVLIFNMILLLSSTLSIVSKMNYVSSVIVYFETSIDRLAPYEKPSKLIELKAQFREVDTAKEYYQLYDNIEALLKSNNLSSRSVKPL